jgi:hypothetical protein
MTAREIYDLALRGGGNDFQATVELLERLGEPWCLIGGLAINVYCEPVYTNDADFIVVISQLELVCAELAGLGFTISRHRFSVNAQLPSSSLIVQFTTDPRYQDFLARATPDGEVLGVQCRVAALADLFQGKLWAAADPERRPTKRAKDELDLLRIADTYPKYLPLLPPALRARLGK